MSDTMTAPLLHIDQLGKRFGGFVALDGVDLSVPKGQRLGLIGPNGSGKSTLVNCICGTLQNETGSVAFDGRKIDGMVAHQRTHHGLARSFQLPRPFKSMTVAQNIRVPLLYTVNARAGTHLSHSELDDRCMELLKLVTLDAKAGKYTTDLTQVEMRKLELARAMAAEPKLLIADESMAGLSHSEVEDIVALLIRMNERGVTIIMIEHIMRAVMTFSQRLVVLVSGKKIADGKPEDVIQDKEVVGAYLGQYTNSITVENIDAAYGAVRVLENVSLRVDSGETVVLLGTNGNGKSTLMKCIMGWVRPNKGKIVAEIDGEKHDLAGMTTEQIVDLGIALVPEGRRLFPRQTVEENLLLGASRPKARPHIKTNLAFCFEIFPRLAERRGQLAGSMSGGEQQMLALARALMLNPRILLVDEPSVGLAPLLVSRTIDAIGQLKKHFNLTVLMAEQNFTQALRIADRGYVIVHGKIEFEGSSADELNNNDLIRQFYLGM